MGAIRTNIKTAILKTAIVALAGLGAALAAPGCAAPYKDALCRLGQSSTTVADHYAGYVANEPDPMTKQAREAESTEFRKAIAEAAQQCSK